MGRFNATGEEQSASSFQDNNNNTIPAGPKCDVPKFDLYLLLLPPQYNGAERHVPSRYRELDQRPQVCLCLDDTVVFTLFKQ